MEIEHKKNTAKYLAMPMVSTASPGSFVSGESVTDTAYYKDGAGAWTSLAITDTFSEIGSTGVYEIDLTASELNHDQVLIKLTSTNGADTMVLFQMYTNDIDDLATSSSISALNDISAADVNAQCDTAISDAALATAASISALNDVSVADILAGVVEGSLTLQQVMRIMLAESAGLVSVSGSTVNFRDVADTKNRISSTCDANGQRTAIVLDGS